MINPSLDFAIKIKDFQVFVKEKQLCED